MNSLRTEIDQIEARISDLGVTIAFVCKRAKVSTAAWSQWKAGNRNPTKFRWDAVVAEVADLEARLRKEDAA